MVKVGLSLQLCANCCRGADLSLTQRYLQETKNTAQWGQNSLINYRFLTTETNLKALYIFRCLFTTSSVKLFVVNVQIFVYNCVFRKKEKQHSQNLSHFENESTFQKRTTFWKWKLILTPILKMKTYFWKPHSIYQFTNNFQ